MDDFNERLVLKARDSVLDNLQEVQNSNPEFNSQHAFFALGDLIASIAVESGVPEKFYKDILLGMFKHYSEHEEGQNVH